jgi:hypothetical protein
MIENVNQMVCLNGISFFIVIVIGSDQLIPSYEQIISN